MDSLDRTILLNCKKCSSPLFTDFELDLMKLPVDNDNEDEISDILIPTTQTHENHEIIEVPPNIWTNDFLGNDMGISSDLAYKIQIANNIFKYMSGNSEIDHPMCQDCANDVIENQEKMLVQSEEELKALENYLKGLKEKKFSLTADNENTLEKLQEDEEKLLEELKALQFDNAQLDKDIEEENIKLEQSEIHYDKVVQDYNNKKQILWDLEEDIRSLSQRKKYLSFLAERLKRTNVLNVLFPIWLEDHFGMINGLRMGRLSEVTVEWAEINAGWGQCVLLLQNLARKIELTFNTYKLIPCGNASMIENIVDKKKYKLFHSGGFILVPNRNFDQAMIAFLDCLNQTMVRIEAYDNTFQFPYKVVDKHKLMDSEDQTFSIKFSSNSNENWTKALKYMLIDLKWITTWMVKASFKQYCDSVLRKPRLD